MDCRKKWGTIFDFNYHPHKPKLIPHPLEFFNMDMAPIPVGFFLDLNQTPFWSCFVKRYTPLTSLQTFKS
jgi:hypothetical protein